MFGETVEALRPARLHPFEHRDRDAVESDRASVQGQFRLAAVLGKGDGRKPVDNANILPVFKLPQRLRGVARRVDRLVILHPLVEFLKIDALVHSVL